MAKVTTSLCLEDQISKKLKTINNNLRKTNDLMKQMSTNATNLKGVAKMEQSFTATQAQLEKTKLKLAEMSSKYQEATDKISKYKVAQQEANNVSGKASVPLEKTTQSLEKQLTLWDKIKNSLATRFAIGNIVANLALNAMYGIRDMVGGAIKYASDLVEVQNVVDVAYGNSSKACDAWAKTTLKAYGINEMNAKKYAGTLASMIQSSGIAQKKAGQMSMDLTGLAGDLASYYNIQIDEAFNKLRSGISGMVIPLRKLGIDISVATMQEYAHSVGIRKKWKEMSQAEKVMLRYNYLMQRTGIIQGDFIKTQYTFANQLRLVQQNWQEYTGMLAQNFLPIFNLILIATNNLIYGLENLSKVWNNVFLKMLPYVIGIAIGFTAILLPAIVANTLALISGAMAFLLMKTIAIASFIAMNAPIFITFGLIVGLIFILQKCGVTFGQVAGVAVGAFTGVIAVIQNVCTWVNVLIQKIGVYLDMAREASKDPAHFNPQKFVHDRMDKIDKNTHYKDVGKEAHKGYSFGKKWGDSTYEKVKKALTLQTHFGNNGRGFGNTATPGGSGKHKKRKKRGDKSNPVYTKMSDQDIQALVDVAKVNYINKYIKMQPTVQASFGDIHENADVNGLMNEMANILEETQNSSIA